MSPSSKNMRTMQPDPQKYVTVENLKNAPWWETASSDLPSTKQPSLQIVIWNFALDYVKPTLNPLEQSEVLLQISTQKKRNCTKQIYFGPKEQKNRI